MAAPNVQSISGINPSVATPLPADAPAAAVQSASNAGPSFGDLRALRTVAGAQNIGVSLPAPRPMQIAQADTDEPDQTDDPAPPDVPPSDDVPGTGAMTLEERQSYIHDLAEAILAGRAEGVDTTENESQLSEALWTCPDEERRPLAQWLSSTQITTPDGDQKFLDQALDESLDNAAWRSFSFFMYEYTAGFGDDTVPPVIVDGGYDAPPWWYESRPYGEYTPYWEYRLPDTCPFPSLPIVVIDIPGRGHYRGPERDHHWHFPRDRGHRFPREPHGRLPNPHTPIPRPHGPRDPGHHGPRDPGHPHDPGHHGPRDPGHHGPREPGPNTPAPPRGPRGPQQPPHNPAPAPRAPLPRVPHVPRAPTPRAPAPRAPAPRAPAPRAPAPRAPVPRAPSPHFPSPGGGGHGGGGRHR